MAGNWRIQGISLEEAYIGSWLCDCQTGNAGARRIQLVAQALKAILSRKVPPGEILSMQ